MKSVSKYRVMISQTSAEHAGEPGSDGKFAILTKTMRIMEPGDVCTHSYIYAGEFEKREMAENLYSYLRIKFARILMLQTLTSIHISKTTAALVPIQDFTRSWCDSDLYEKYELNEDEIWFIESLIRAYE